MNLIPGVEIDLKVVGSTNRERFASAFRAVWDSLPAYARNSLTSKWTLMPGRVYLTIAWQGVESQLAACSVNGSCFHFLVSAVDIMPDDVLRVCIAHELAHAFFYVTGDPYHGNVGLDEATNRKLAEALAHEMSGVWGYPHGKLRAWMTVNLETLQRNAEAAVQRLR